MKKFIILILLLSASLINITVYAESVTFTVMVNDNKISFEQSPILVNDRLLVPVRTFMDAVGGITNWDDETESIYLMNQDKSINLKINDSTAIVNGEVKNLDVTPQLLNNTSMVSIRFIAESLGCEIGWLDFFKTVYIGIMQENFNYDFNLTYTICLPPAPVELMGYKITINGNGKFVKTYLDANRNIVKYISSQKMERLINCVTENEFFNLPQNIDGSTNVSDQATQSLTISYNGKNHTSGGYHITDSRYLEIVDAIIN